MSVNIKDRRRTLVVKPEWFPRPDGLERALVFQPGYNDDNPDRAQSCGVHGMEITWYLRGPKGCVYLTVTVPQWVPGELTPGHGLPPRGYPPIEPQQHPDGFGLRYCAPVPQYDGQGAPEKGCPLIGASCYSDISFGGADEPAERFTEHGEAAVWAVLEKRYAGLIAPAEAVTGDA